MNRVGAAAFTMVMGALMMTVGTILINLTAPPPRPIPYEPILGWITLAGYCIGFLGAGGVLFGSPEARYRRDHEYKTGKGVKIILTPLEQEALRRITDQQNHYTVRSISEGHPEPEEMKRALWSLLGAGTLRLNTDLTLRLPHKGEPFWGD